MMKNLLKLIFICSISAFILSFFYLCGKVSFKRMDWLNLHISLPITDPTWIFFLVLIIILFAPMVMGKLRIPHIVGMILAGVLVGEHGLNLLELDSSFTLFGKVGLYYIMFLAGLEMDLDDFKKNRTKAMVFGLFTFLIPMGLGIWSSMSLLGYGLLTSILLASMYASHTLIAYPVISRYGLSRLRSVNITIGGTAVTVVLALLVLAVIGGMFKGEGNGVYWLVLVLRVVLLGILIVILVPRLSRWFFHRYDDAVMQYVFVLAMVFLGGGLMEFVGMEGILGAFLAGLVMNRFVPHVSPLMNRIEFVGNALFIPYFLISVGMMIDVRCLFTEGEALKVAVVMTVVATVSKWLAAWITQKLYGMSREERGIIFGLSNAQAAATLAAVLIGHRIILANGEPLLNDDVLNGTVVMILFTCIISSVATERAARKMATQEAALADEKDKKQEHILISVANPETIEGLVDVALMLKNPRQKEPMMALSVVNDQNSSEAKEMRAKRNLEKVAMIAASVDTPVKTLMRYSLNVAQGIVHTVKENEITDVVIGLHRKTSLMDSFFGAMTESLLKGTHREVLITKLLIPMNTMRRIVVAVPQKAEYEAGFSKWVEQLCRLSKQTACRMRFFAHPSTLKYLRVVIGRADALTMAEFSELEDWDDLLILTGEMNFDHLFVVVSARKGSISYQTSFEKLPAQISRYFANNSLMIVYPDQLGEAEEIVSFSDPRGEQEARAYEAITRWIYRWVKRRNED
jgi:Kef-type K+ transport system membrane component KefB